MSKLHSDLSLAKYQALGNDYLVLDEPALFEPLLPLVPRICDRNLGVGSDGVLYVDVAARAVRVINPDGSEAERSGNGLRIAAAHLVLEHDAPGAFTLRTAAGETGVRVVSRTGGEVVSELSLGVPRVGPRERLEGAGVEGHAVDVGNPHFVIFGEPVTAARARELGPLVERHERFPNRTNVQLAEAAEHGLRIEIWERGAGYTLASGTSAAAAAAAAMAAGLCADAVRVVMPGGTLEVRREAGWNLFQTGPARRVFAAVLRAADFDQASWGAAAGPRDRGR